MTSAFAKFAIQDTFLGGLPFAPLHFAKGGFPNRLIVAVATQHLFPSSAASLCFSTARIFLCLPSVPGPAPKSALR
jgi:hypothetical protein